MTDDLHWTAFRYLDNSLSADEVTVFEALLLDSQEAREALASAVELQGAIVASRTDDVPSTLSAPVPATRVARERLMAWRHLHLAPWGLVGAAVLCFVAGVYLAPLARRGSSQVAAQPGDPAHAGGDVADRGPLAPTSEEDALAVLWADHLSGVDVVGDNSAEHTPLGAAFEPLLVVDSGVTNDEAGFDFETPSWMLAALGEESPAEDDDDRSEESL